eukprot:m.263228 g.263228  ORF g.263228 m.263228 type:complete len:764 (+) comp40455_c0_seq11:720-3011(+)
MRTACAPDWPNDEKSLATRLKCENSTRSALLKDLLVTLPVAAKMFTYPNVYCALCNHESSTDLTNWTPPLYCDLGGNETEKLRQDTAQTLFDGCSIAYFSPPTIPANATEIYNPIRPCRQAVSICLSYEDLNSKLGYNISISNYSCLKEQCQSFTDYINGGENRLHPLANREGDVYYRNRFCAFCNGIALNKLSCFSELRLFSGRCTFGCTSFFTVLNFLPNGGVDLFVNEEMVTIADSCPEGYVYDPSSLNCVFLVCPDGKELVGEKCVSQRSLDIQFVLFSNSATLNESVYNNISDLQDLTMRSLAKDGRFLNTTLAFTSFGIVNNSVHVKVKLTSAILTDAQWRLLNQTFLNVSLSFTFAQVQFSSSEFIISPGGNQLSCAYVQLNATQYNNTANGSVIDLTTGETLDSTEYVSLPNNSILRCNVFEREFNKTVTIKIWNYDDVAIILSSVISLFTSLVCFILVITYLLFKDLRNLPGLCIMSYSLSLGSSFIFIVFGAGQTDNEAVCTAMGFLLHFFTLSHFTWSSVLAFNLLNTFVTVRMRKPETASKAIRQKFAIFSLYAWGFPLIVCSICVALDYLTDVNVTYSSETICWLQFNFAVLYAIGIPAGLILIFNTCCFVGILVVLNRNLSSGHKVSKLADEKARLSKIQKKARVFLGMFSLLGLTFSVAYIAALVGELWLWYIFMAANLFQAIVMLFVFILKKKVRGMYVRLFTGKGLGAEDKTKSKSLASMTSLSKSQISVNMIPPPLSLAVKDDRF